MAAFVAVAMACATVANAQSVKTTTAKTVKTTCCEKAKKANANCCKLKAKGDSAAANCCKAKAKVDAKTSASAQPVKAKKAKKTTKK